MSAIKRDNILVSKTSVVSSDESACSKQNRSLKREIRRLHNDQKDEMKDEPSELVTLFVRLQKSNYGEEREAI